MSRRDTLRLFASLALCASLSVLSAHAHAAVLASQGALRNAGSGPVADANYLIVMSSYDAVCARLAGPLVPAPAT